ncbi:MAG: error-prone DNA polymerase [Cellulomonadaceae bacterium]|jgi:error-prone DNA polymerase|nr:error-prone DNA polymerase [Cellulomonadaceae bacterium]
MSHVRYGELHAHSSYSFLDGASQPEEMVAEAARLGLSALAITDHDGLYGAVKHAEAARLAGLGTVFGAELHLSPVDEPTGVPDPRSEHLLVLARNAAGYQHLSSAIGLAKLEAGVKGKANYRMEALGEQADGQWLVLTGCRKGAVRTALHQGGLAQGGWHRGELQQNSLSAARRELHRLMDTFGRDNVAVEITATGTSQDAPLHDALAELAREARLPLVATTGAHYATQRDAELARALAAVRARQSMEEMEGWMPAAQIARLRSPQQMARLHHRYPQAVITAADLASECAFDLKLVAPDLPPYPVPPGHTEASHLRALVESGGTRRYGPRDQETVPGAWKQLDHELDIIETLNFPGYFLVVYDIAEFCRERGILSQGRGSAANSAVCYALGITAVDAVHHGLLFERFLAPERDGPPDIDVDIESVRREEVIQHVYEKFGRTYAAQVANVISYRPRSAIRDAAKAHGYDVGQQDAWSKSVDRWRDLSAGEDLDHIPQHVTELAQQFLKLPRHLGIHSGGMVMCDRPVIEVCPVEWARMEGRTVLQWDKEDCADAGLVKFDLLGLGMLTAIRYAFEGIEARTGEHLTLHGLPRDDPAVYDLLCAADTIGVFQVESRAQMATLPRVRPRCFYDIVVEVALIRPGPIQGGAVHPYIARRRGREPVTYLHPLLEPSLKRTLGVPLFQEQLMQMAIDVAGFTPTDADQLRRAMGSKRSVERMEALKDRLFSGMKKNSVPSAERETIYSQLRGFADFGFPESHAYSFAFLVYVSAWLKVHHPAAFYAGILAAQPMGFYSPQTLCADARRHGVTVLRPCVNASAALTSVEHHADSRDGLAVRLGLAEVRNFHKATAEEVVAARPAGGFADIRDVARRVTLSTPQWEALATAGSLECFGITRREALWAAGALGQEGPDTLPGISVGVEAPVLPEMSAGETVTADAWATGMTPGFTATEAVRADLERAGVLTVGEVFTTEVGRRVAAGGMVTHRQRPGTARGVTFISLEDETGLLNVVCSEGLWKRFSHVARRSPALVVRGRVERGDGATNLIAEHLAPLALPVKATSRDFR